MSLHLFIFTSFFSLFLGIVAYDNASFEDDGLNVALETCVMFPSLMSSVVYEADGVKKLPLLGTGSGNEGGRLKKKKTKKSGRLKLVFFLPLLCFFSYRSTCTCKPNIFLPFTLFNSATCPYTCKITRHSILHVMWSKLNG